MSSLASRFTVFVLAALPAIALAEGAYQGPISQLGVLGDGTVFIEFPVAITIGPCSHAQIRVPVSNPARKEILAVALSAYLTGINVRVQTDGCFGVYPTLSGTDSWIYPKP